MTDTSDLPREPTMNYMAHLTTVTETGNDLIREKTRTYGASWKQRGGAGAWFTMVRPWDRLERIVAGYDWDIFKAIADAPAGKDGTALACVRDLRNYLTLIEAEMVARGVVRLPARGVLEGSPRTTVEAVAAERGLDRAPEDAGRVQRALRMLEKRGWELRHTRTGTADESTAAIVIEWILQA